MINFVLTMAENDVGKEENAQNAASIFFFSHNVFKGHLTCSHEDKGLFNKS